MKSPKTLLRSGLAALALAAFATPAAALAADNPYEKGPAPTAASLAYPNGTYGFTRTYVSNSVSSVFGDAQIWAPVTTTGETFGVVAVSPGFTENESAIRWLGQRLVQRGFIVITFNTNGIFDQPTARARALLGALDYVVKSSPVKALVDPSRLAVIGHSMGGGGTLEAAKARPSIKAVVALAPWDGIKNWSSITTPSLVVAAQNDFIAPRGDHAIPFYNTIPATTPKTYAEIKGADHFVTNKATTNVQTLTIAWLKRFLDNDKRYESFLCPAPNLPGFSGLKNNCSEWAG